MIKRKVFHYHAFDCVHEGLNREYHIRGGSLDKETYMDLCFRNLKKNIQTDTKSDSDP